MTEQEKPVIQATPSPERQAIMRVQDKIAEGQALNAQFMRNDPVCSTKQ